MDRFDPTHCACAYDMSKQLIDKRLSLKLTERLVAHQSVRLLINEYWPAPCSYNW